MNRPTCIKETIVEEKGPAPAWRKGRRALLTFIPPALAALALAGCVTGCAVDPTTSKVTLQVDLPHVQAEATTLLNAATLALASVPGAATPLAAFQAAVQTLNATTVGGTALQYASDAVAAFIKLEPFLNLAGPVGVGVGFALAFLQAFIAGQPTMTVPASAMAVGAPLGGPAAPIYVPAMTAR